MPFSKLAHTRTGTGEPIVLIHGIGHRRQAFDPIVPILAKTHEVIAVDLAGFGSSPPYPKGIGYNMENGVKNLVDNFRAWGVERPHVAGNSLGGALALELALRGHARSVTALSPAGFFGVAGRIRSMVVLIPIRLISFLPLALLRFALSKTFLRHLSGMALYAHPERFTAAQILDDAISMRGSKAFGPTMLKAPTYSYSGQPPVPTTIAWGEQDRVLPIGQAETAKERLPHAQHVRLPGCGHVPMSDDPELVAKVILDTVLRAESRQAS